MVKKFRRQHVYVTEGLEDAGTVAPPKSISMTLFISIFADGFMGPCFIIIPEKKLKINEEVKNHFGGTFSVKFYFKLINKHILYIFFKKNNNN
jgi:hypothetical protein